MQTGSRAAQLRQRGTKVDNLYSTPITESLTFQGFPRQGASDTGAYMIYPRATIYHPHGENSASLVEK